MFCPSGTFCACHLSPPLESLNSPQFLFTWIVFSSCWSPPSHPGSGVDGICVTSGLGNFHTSFPAPESPLEVPPVGRGPNPNPHLKSLWTRKKTLPSPFTQLLGMRALDFSCFKLQGCAQKFGLIRTGLDGDGDRDFAWILLHPWLPEQILGGAELGAGAGERPGLDAGWSCGMWNLHQEPPGTSGGSE